MRFIKKMLYWLISNHLMKGCSDYNPLHIRKACRSKQQARAAFAKNNIPHAQGLIFFNPIKAWKFAKVYGFPLVVKPNIGGFSRGSYFPIENKRSLLKALFLAKLWWPTTVIEQYLAGKNYRVLVTKGEIISVIERFAPYVVGDGQHTIEQLIDQENAERKRMRLLPCMQPLNKGRKVRKHIKQQGYHLQDVLSAGTTLTLFHRVSLAQGGTVNTLDTTQIADANQALFLQITQYFDANILGIDVIFSQSIKTPHQEQHCIFLEVNSRPYITMHHYPRHGDAMDLSATLQSLETLNVTPSDTY